MAAAPKVDALISAIDNAFSDLTPECVVPDTEGLLEHFPEVFEAISRGLRRLADTSEEELPLHGDVPEGMREMIPTLDGLADRAREVFTTFKSRHEEDLRRHYEPRTGETKWNVPR